VSASENPEWKLARSTNLTGAPRDFFLCVEFEVGETLEEYLDSNVHLETSKV
jgi:hypothetical protein